MYIVRPNSATQSEREEGFVGTVGLLGLVDMLVRKTGTAALSGVAIPDDIIRISVEGHVYRLSEDARRRKIWFKKDTSMTSFYVSEVIDAKGRDCQLQMARPESGLSDDLRLVHSTPLPRAKGFSPFGRSPNIDARSLN